MAQPYWNHNGGQIAFGPDGYLYIGLGDGGAGGDPKNHGQNMNTLLGSIIRIDVNSTNGNKKYGIPADNPFVGKKGVQPEIFAYGLRNPWRFSFDPKTGDLICADVGQNKQEEVDFIVSGGNYGWRVYEGDSTFKREKPVAGVEYLKPLKAYPRNMGTSITGGFVYRGTKIPSLQGYYIYCDYASNNFWVLKQQRGKLIENHHIGKYRFAVSSFAVDHQGELYLCSFKEGNIVRIVGFE